MRAPFTPKQEARLREIVREEVRAAALQAVAREKYQQRRAVS